MIGFAPEAARVGDASLIYSSGTTTRYELSGAHTRRGVPAPPPDPDREKKDHATSFGVVYANEPAARILLSLSPGKFPIGSVIVREKLARADATEPEMLAVMIKRGPDFNPAGGDWEFLVFDGELKRLRERQKKGSCLECHASQQSRDFVFPIPQRQE